MIKKSTTNQSKFSSPCHKIKKTKPILHSSLTTVTPKMTETELNISSFINFTAMKAVMAVSREKNTSMVQS
ncbi:hypothetical protein SAMN04488057_102344 [Cyclobacterium lianum]|uniref:Uncharacterized protein n=1 Tax=Cyclobacterium lianum TaxID=388280 RepID=A0A1M7K8Q8_9BACT|nr:hypothetical protein SAMN04488057_102344 [Cyclobacterium lianum]